MVQVLTEDQRAIGYGLPSVEFLSPPPPSDECSDSKHTVESGNKSIYLSVILLCIIRRRFRYLQQSNTQHELSMSATDVTALSMQTTFKFK